MNFKVMNKNQVIEYANKSHDDTALVISINRANELPTPILPNGMGTTNNIKAILHVQFDDVNKDEPNAMTELHAAHIAMFMSKYTADTLIVQCEAGQSRSAGVCAAIMKALTGNDMQIYKDPKYTPNFHCYTMTLNAMMGLKSEESES